jgi:hypothetical protein
MNCSTCFYLRDQAGAAGTCQRYPQPRRTAASYWCGEHKAKEEPKPAPKRKPTGKKNATTN